MEKIQEILNNGLEEYEKENKIVMYKKKVINAIKNCKTANIGAHKYICDECGYEEIAYNSCRNRHCPNCQNCKEPFKNAECVIQYLGRYTHRVAISNERILKIEGEKVTFKWRDYKDNNKMKEMTISIQEFIRRFLMHILPPHFMKIRYYGLLGNRNKKKKLLFYYKIFEIAY